MKRRSFLSNILAAGVAPAAVGSGILMPIKAIVVPEFDLNKIVMQSLVMQWETDVASAYPEVETFQNATIAEVKLFLDEWHNKVMLTPHHFPSIRHVL